MPHVVVKLWPGKSAQQKTVLADKIVKDVKDVLHYGEESVSLTIEEVGPQDWTEKVTHRTFKRSGTSFTKSQDTNRFEFISSRSTGKRGY
jgi:4-oxalocrotonate tautomerase